MHNIDRVDEQIVRLLGEDARKNSEALAKELNLSSATVRRRLRKLIGGDLVRIVGVVDPARFGFPVFAVITLDVAHEKVESALEELSKQPQIRMVSTITGQYNVMITARFRSNDCLAEFMKKELANLEGVRDSETFICLEVKKGLRTPLTELL